MSTITVETARRGSRVTFRVTGDLDYCNDEVLLSAVRAAVLDASVTDVDVDVSGAGYCDSTGLGALITIHAIATDRGMVMRLLGPPPPLMRMLELTGLDSYFAIWPAPVRRRPVEPEDDPPPLPRS